MGGAFVLLQTMTLQHALVVSLLSVVRKIFGKLLNNRIVDHFDY